MFLDFELRQLLNKSILSENVFILIGLGANPDLLSAGGYSLLHLLIFNKRMNDAMRLIRHHKANINLKDLSGFPPLYYMLSDKFSADNLIEMIRLGADTTTVNSHGRAPIHYLIKKNFELAKELLAKDSRSINFKSDEGTPLEIMINSQKEVHFKAEYYIEMVRLGADIYSKNSEGESLLNVIIGMNKLEKAKELVVLSNVPVKERRFFRPQLSDYFVREDGIQSLVDDLKNNELKPDDMTRLGKYPYAKELVIKHLKQLHFSKSSILIEEALTPRTSLNYFFSVQRGWFITSNNRGTLHQLLLLQKEMNDKKAADVESHKEDLPKHRM